MLDLLIVGGTGKISWRCAELALDAGWSVTVLNRGGVSRVRRQAFEGCKVLTADIRDSALVHSLLGDRVFDVVIDVLCYNSTHAKQAVEYFAKRTKQYVFISTTAVYDREKVIPPFTEESSLMQSGWDYAIAKAEAEQVFLEAYRERGFPVTIIRAAHTYDTIVPVAVGDADWTVPWRLLAGKPIVVHGDGTTLWTLTHSTDFAKGTMGLLGMSQALGEIFHITSDEVYTWRQVTYALCHALGVDNPDIRYRTSEEIFAVSPRLKDGILWHKMWCDVYDNKKIKSFCPSWQTQVSLEQGMAEMVRYFQSNNTLLVPNESLNTVLDSLCDVR